MAGQSAEKKVWYIRNGVKGLDFATLPHCQAIAETTGERCKRPALKNQDYCGIHSGKYRPGAPFGNRNNFKHGRCGKGFRKRMDNNKAFIERMQRQIGALTQTLK